VVSKHEGDQNSQEKSTTRQTLLVGNSLELATMRDKRKEIEARYLEAHGGGRKKVSLARSETS